MNEIHSVSVQETNPNVHDEFCEQIEVCASYGVEKLSNSHVERLIGHQETNWKPGLRVASRKWFVWCTICVAAQQGVLSVSFCAVMSSSAFRSAAV